MTDKEKQFNQWFDEYADGVNVFEEADMKQAYLQGRAELEKENAELKEELKDANKKVVHLACNQNKDLKRKITKAKELLKRCYDNYIYLQPLRGDIEQFLNSEVEK